MFSAEPLSRSSNMIHRVGRNWKTIVGTNEQIIKTITVLQWITGYALVMGAVRVGGGDKGIKPLFSPRGP